jgi:hypothetical protein
LVTLSAGVEIKKSISEKAPCDDSFDRNEFSNLICFDVSNGDGFESGFWIDESDFEAAHQLRRKTLICGTSIARRFVWMLPSFEEQPVFNVSI